MEAVARNSEENYLERKRIHYKGVEWEKQRELSKPRRKSTEESLHAANKRHEEQSFRGHAV